MSTMQYSRGAIDPHTSVAALTYITAKLPKEKRTTHSVFKALYEAEKRMLDLAGMSIVYDNFAAMDFGPVPTVLFDLVKMLRGDGQVAVNRELLALAQRHLEVVEDDFFTRAEPDMMRLSVLGVEALDYGVERVELLDFDGRTAQSHDEAWAKAREFAKANGAKAWPMTWEDIAMTLPDGELLVEHLQNPYPS